MKRGNLALLVLLVLLVLGGIGYYLYRNLEPYTETVEHGASPEARANPYLAAEMYLRGAASVSPPPAAWKCWTSCRARARP